ncbi:MAG TPA: hypothetical protein VNN07_08430 [Candidatus Tectomicrobia bacterium]|nr:hypothetical protein [Candidatus Tectomicrobia bacterium]
MGRAIALVIAASLLFAGSAFAQGLKVKPLTFDPDDTGISSAAWVTHQGLPDAGGSDHALYLGKSGPTSTNAAALAQVDGEEGLVLTELGFDVRDDGHCGAGAPRFNVRISTGELFFFGCAHGTATAAGPGWKRIRFDDGDAFPQVAGSIWPGFGNAVVTSIVIVFDEGTDVGVGLTHLDNIDVNGVLIGKPGLAN